MNVRLGALKLYRRHLLDQYADRCGVWATRDISGEEMGRCVIMVTDGADQVSKLSLYFCPDSGYFPSVFYFLRFMQLLFGTLESFLKAPLTHLEAKYQVPRDPELRSAYRTSKLRRPRLKVHGVWAYNYLLNIAVLEENTQHGSSLVAELIATTLEQVVEIAHRKGLASPTTLVVVGDNTVKELKNQFLMGYASLLVGHSKLQHLSLSVYILLVVCLKPFSLPSSCRHSIMLPRWQGM